MPGAAEIDALDHPPRLRFAPDHSVTVEFIDRRISGDPGTKIVTGKIQRLMQRQKDGAAPAKF